MTSSRGRGAAKQAPAAPPRLLVPVEQLREEIDERLTKGQDLIDRSGDEAALKKRRHEYYTWTEYNETLLRRSFDQPEPADTYARTFTIGSIGGPPDPLPVQWQELRDDVSGKMRRLLSVQERLGLYDLQASVVAGLPKPRAAVGTGDGIFIVHGHDGATKTMVARFLRELTGKEPVILHEQPDRGRTIIEKFEDHASDATFAIVLLTGDDDGGEVGQPQRRRARQNVVFELGFFIGALRRSNVVILYEPDVELPSDMSGVLYIPLDPEDAWRNRVARELKAADVNVNLEALLR